MKKSIVYLLLILVFESCKSDQKTSSIKNPKSIAVILVNHGSRSATWREALWQLEQNVKDTLLTYENVSMVKTAFMEYTEPSLATQLKACDSAGVSDIIIVPVFLTVSSHSFEDIPTIAGIKQDAHSVEELKLENIECYKPKANCHITPLLDFAGVMKDNVLRRCKSLSTDPSSEGLTLIGYGDARYDKEWSTLFEDIAQYVNKNLGINQYSYGWCGHIVHYSSDNTTAAIERTLKTKQTSLVVPVLLSMDEQFQIKIIGDGIQGVKDHATRVRYKPDAILPEPLVDAWIKEISMEYIQKINHNNPNGVTSSLDNDDKNKMEKNQ